MKKTKFFVFGDEKNFSLNWTLVFTLTPPEGMVLVSADKLTEAAGKIITHRKKVMAKKTKAKRVAKKKKTAAKKKKK